MIVRANEGVTGVKPYVRLVRHQWVVRKARVELGIFDHQRIVAEDGVGAERYAARGFTYVKPNT